MNPTTFCPLDCPDACSLRVETVEGRATVLDGTSLNPVTAGYICAKVRRFPEAMYGPERVLRPLRRRGAKGKGDFEAIAWDEALTVLATRLAEIRDAFGGEAILPLSYGGSNGYLSQGIADERLFRRLGASRLARTVCAAATGRAAGALTGKMPGVAYEDFVHARLIVVWGANPVASGIHLLPYIQEAQKRGAKLVVIDPRRTRLARRADLHLAPFPGTDLALAMGVIQWLFENDAADLGFLERHATGVAELRERAATWNLHHAASLTRIPAEDLERFARLYAESSPALIRCGWGLERNRNGGSAVAAVLALPAVAGKFGVRGGGYTLSNSGGWGLDPEAAVAAPPVSTRILNMNRVGRELTEPRDVPVKSVFVYNHNPVMTLPRQDLVIRGFEREDLFTVVFDSFMTDTARYADLVLPASTFLEREEMRHGYGAYALFHAAGVLAPVGESRNNHEVFLDLVDRLGLGREDDPRTESECLDLMFAAHPHGEALRRALLTDGIATPHFGTHPVQFADVFPATGDQRIHLCPVDLDAEAPEGLYGYRKDPATRTHPLALISPSTNKTVSSTLGQLVEGEVPLEMHNADALPRGLRDGDPVRVFNEHGEVRCRVRFNPDVRLGVVSLPKGLWARHTANGVTSNTLSPDTLTDLGQGACFNDARVQVEKIPG